MRRSFADCADESKEDGPEEAGAGAEKDARRDEENDAAKRSIFEMLRDQREAVGVAALQGDSSPSPDEVGEGPGGSQEERSGEGSLIVIDKGINLIFAAEASRAYGY